MEALFAYALALVTVVGFITIFSLPAKKRKFGWIVAAIYVVIYLPFSFLGKFETVNHGGMDWTREWMPLGLAESYQRRSVRPEGSISLGRSKSQLTYAGNLFWPLILLDNLIWHRAHEADLSRDSNLS